MSRAGFVQHVLKCFDVIAPVLPLFVIGIADLPLPGRIVQALFEPCQLLVLGDVQEELQYWYCQLGQQTERLGP